MTAPNSSQLLLYGNKLLVVSALCIGGFTMALMFRVAPLLFWVGVTVFAIRTLADFLYFHKSPPETRQEFREPGRLMNFNHALPISAEWAVMCLSFWGTFIWIGG
ncbi:hypothetical protein K3718_07355 [Leisingera aquaemixtae]|uniref:Uncharacterized protein n=2 Tax=Leisingera aquaemixtae TaxID=1396826 RepID=A0ABY5WN51_9RHOB|nr:hypothetical protein [Leisingera aquaemixtae]UWQ42898.1 hypothetical protein K3718_07355 [Leisingera aquaemixtae]